MSDLIHGERVKRGFPVEKTGDNHFTAYWDAAEHANMSRKFGKVKFNVFHNNNPRLSSNFSDVIISTTMRCTCGCDRNGQIAKHASVPAKKVTPDDQMLGLSFGFGIDKLIDMLMESGCTCLKKSDADAVFHFFDSGEYKKTEIFCFVDAGGNIDLNKINPDALMDIFRTLH